MHAFLGTSLQVFKVSSTAIHILALIKIQAKDCFPHSFNLDQIFIVKPKYHSTFKVEEK